MLLAHQYATSEISTDKRVVCNYEAPPNTEIHTAQPYGSKSVWFVQNGDPAKFMMVNRTSGKTLRAITSPTASSGPISGLLIA